MIEIGGRPILWHIMKIYSRHGINDFVICCGYKGYVIKEYFANYFLHMSDVTFDMAKNTMEVHQQNAEPWRVTLVDTGEDTMTGGRLQRVGTTSSGDESFCFTYGDGVADVDIAADDRVPPRARQAGDGDGGAAARSLRRARARRRRASTASSRSRAATAAWINGGFFVLSPRVHRPHRRRRDDLGAGAARRLAARRRADGVRARRLLAADGHAARQEPARGSVGSGRAPWKSW